MLGQILHRRRTSEDTGEAVDGRVHVEIALLQAARHAHPPGRVSVVPAQFPLSGARRVGAKGDAEGRVETLDRLEDADRGHLHQVVEWFTTMRELTGHHLGQPSVGLDDLVAGAPVPRDPEAGQELVDVGGVVAARVTVRCATPFTRPPFTWPSTATIAAPYPSDSAVKRTAAAAGVGAAVADGTVSAPSRRGICF